MVDLSRVSDLIQLGMKIEGMDKADKRHRDAFRDLADDVMDLFNVKSLDELAKHSDSDLNEACSGRLKMIRSNLNPRPFEMKEGAGEKPAAIEPITEVPSENQSTGECPYGVLAEVMKLGEKNEAEIIRLVESWDVEGTPPIERFNQAIRLAHNQNKERICAETTILKAIIAVLVEKPVRA